MTGRSLAAALLIGSVTAVAAWWYAIPPRQPVTPSNVELAPADAAPASEVRPPRYDAPAFRERMRAFVDSASSLDAGERAAAAAALREDVLTREHRGDLLPAESAYLQLALLRATVTDPAELHRRSQALLDDYQRRSDAGWQAHREQPDIRHQAYRQAEAELVRRTMAGPDPVSQDELRRRLQALREQYYEGDLQ